MKDWFEKAVEKQNQQRPIPQPTNAELSRLAFESGKKRFGSACKHEHVRAGRCTNCLRKVI